MSDRPRQFRCRSCHASLDEVVLDLGVRPDADDFRPAAQAGTPAPRARLDLRRCRSCSLVQLGEPGVPPRGPHGHGALYSTSTTSHLAAWSLGLLGAGVVRPGERALDIGAGAGQLLRPLHEAGVEVVGLEHDPAMVALALADGLDVRRGTFDGPAAEALAASGRPFDLILLNHTLAHAPDLAALVAAVAAVLAPDGTVAVEMHHLLELVRLGQFDLVSPAHGSYLSLIALEPLLAAHDLAAIAAETSPNYGGTLRLLVSRPSVGRPDPAVTAVLGQERAAALDRPDGFAGLAQLMARTVRSVREHLDQAAAAGSPLVGYGAPARGAMLLDMVGATVTTLPYTVDRSPEKQGHLLAGTDIPILAPPVLAERRPDGILILPWPLRDEVAGQLAGLHDAGTRFSVALPILVHVVSAVHPFRFCAPMPVLRDDPGAWRDAVRRLEDWGFSSVSVSEHITGGWTMDPWTVMTAAAAATTRLRILSTVLVNDFRHPVLLHRAAATLDRLTGGRLEVGLGAGWSAEDYGALGLAFDPPGRRIERLGESVRLFKRLCAGEAVDQDGPAYVAHVEAPTPTVQRPHPPVLIGGGGRRVLELAAREADIVGVHARLPVEGVTPETARDLGAAEFTTKLGWVHDAAAAAGRAPGALELQVNVYLCEIGAAAPASGGSRWAAMLANDARLVRESPAVLIGSVEACADLLEERRARFGFSYIRLGGDPAAAAPLVARLSGR